MDKKVRNSQIEYFPCPNKLIYNYMITTNELSIETSCVDENI